MISFTAIFAAFAAGGVPAILTGAGGVVSIATGAVGLFAKNYRVYFIGAGLIALVAASVGVTMWITDLQHKAETLQRIERQNFQLGVEMGCEEGADVLTCWETREKKIAQEHADQLAAQAAEAARTQNALRGDLSRLRRQNSTEKAAIRAAPSADDGDVPKVLGDAWVRERQRRGVR